MHLDKVQRSYSQELTKNLCMPDYRGVKAYAAETAAPTLMLVEYPNRHNPPLR